MSALNFNTTDKKREALSSYANTIDINSRVKDKKAERIAEHISGKSSIRDNKEAKNIIEHFVDNVDVGLLMTVFTMFGTIITTGITLYRALRKFSDGSAYNGNSETGRGGMGTRRSSLFESETIEVFEPIKQFEPLQSMHLKNLYESQDFQELAENEQLKMVEEISEQSMFDVLTNDNLLFKFECGAEMEVLHSNKLPHLPFSLRFFVNKSENVNDFINQIDGFFKVIGKSLTDFDKEALTKHYNRYK